MGYRLKALVTIFSLVLAAAPPCFAENSLNVFLGRMDTFGSGTVFIARVVTNKDGATAAVLTTPQGSYPLQNLGPYWYPAIYGPFEADHSGLPWVDMATVVASDWILVWDEGLPTETTANIGFGQLSEADFAPVPFITYPEKGVEYPMGVSWVEWNYGAEDPCVGPVGETRVLIYDAAGGHQESFGPLPCDAGYVAFSLPSFGADHIVLVDKQINQRATVDGIGGAITGDPWVLENEYWLMLSSRDQTAFNGPIVNVKEMSFGSLKAMFAD